MRALICRGVLFPPVAEALTGLEAGQVVDGRFVTHRIKSILQGTPRHVIPQYEHRRPEPKPLYICAWVASSWTGYGICSGSVGGETGWANAPSIGGRLLGNHGDLSRAESTAPDGEIVQLSRQEPCLLAPLSDVQGRIP